MNDNDTTMSDGFQSLPQPDPTAAVAGGVWPGSPFPQGATYDGRGTNFSLYSEGADGVDLCLFDADGTEHRVPMVEQDAWCYHAYLPSVEPGQHYAYRVDGPWKPEQGLRFNSDKLLLDPYSKAVNGSIKWGPEVYGYQVGDGSKGSTDYTQRDDRDSAPNMPRSVVVNPYFEWENDHRPKRPLHDLVIYEAHVKGMTMRHPDIEPELRGTYAGLASEPVIEHLINLGVNAIELMPVHQFVTDHRLVDLGLTNYWGYQSVGYLAPHHGYASWGVNGQQVQEFKHLVHTMHQAGIEVILDVVYNHTGEGDHRGPNLSMRGVDNDTYYRLDHRAPELYVDYTGTGNSLNVRSPHVLRLIMDSLRYWINDMRVDGFRFDLASALARELHDVDRLSSFFDIIQQDPVISQVKLIAEPWDIGEGGYQVGNFPVLWSEWNGKYRDNVRRYWRGDEGQLGEFAYRFTGSSDLYAANGRRPMASINFVTAHDGFTMHDLVSYDEKHNMANGEDNADGESHNLSWNGGVEGPTDNAHINDLRKRRVRSFLATMMLSQGVPMLLMGDELGRTQGGNNNAYCQDNEISWMDWDAADDELLGFARTVIGLRSKHPIFRRRRWFIGTEVIERGLPDIEWYTPAGTQMEPHDWDVPYARALAVALFGSAIPSPDRRGRPVVDDDFIVLFNAGSEAEQFHIAPDLGDGWCLDLNSADVSVQPGANETVVGELITVESFATIVLRRPAKRSESAAATEGGT